jgi:hypothetical protein
MLQTTTLKRNLVLEIGEKVTRLKDPDGTRVLPTLKENSSWWYLDVFLRYLHFVPSLYSTLCHFPWIAPFRSSDAHNCVQKWAHQGFHPILVIGRYHPSCCLQQGSPHCLRMCIYHFLGRFTKAKTAYRPSPYSLLLFGWFSLQNLRRWPSAKYCMLALWTWWDRTSQGIWMASLYSLLKHFIGVNKVDSVRGTCTFKGWKVAL